MGGTLTKVDIGHGRGWLEAEAAASQARIDHALGHPQQITEAGRSWERQNAHWLTFQKYGTPIALHPNTPSVHQKGRAKDTDERDVALMNDHGWFQTVYRVVNGRRTLVEPWHFEYDPERDNHRNDPAPAGGATVPTPKGATVPTPKEDDTMLMLRVHYKKGTHKVALGNKTFRHFIDADPHEKIMRVERSADDWQDIEASELPAFLRTHGCDLNIYRSATGEVFEVLDPLTGKFGQGNVWTAENATRAEIRALKKTLTGQK